MYIIITHHSKVELSWYFILLFFYIISYYVISYYIFGMLYYIILYHIILCYVISFHFILLHRYNYITIPVPGLKGTLGNKGYLCCTVDILDKTYQLSTPDIITTIPTVVWGSKNSYRLIGTTRESMPSSILV